MSQFLKPILFLVAVWMLLYVWNLAKQTNEDVAQRADISAPSLSQPQAPRRDARFRVLQVVRDQDPDFSLVLLEDFAYTLYAESQRARHDPAALALLAPYWGERPKMELSLRQPRPGRVEAVVVGSLWPIGIEAAKSQLRVQYAFEANLHVQPMQTSGAVAAPPVTQYVEEIWTFTRDAKLKTKPWTGVRKLGCPKCGAPFRSTTDARCESCGVASGGGRFDWHVSAVVVVRQESRPETLTGTAQEVGTEEPTRWGQRVKERLAELYAADPAVTQASLEARLRLIYETLQSAWTAQDLRPVRPFVSDRQYAYLQYWIDAYKERGLRNVMERPRFERFVIARVERDAHYDAVTVRFWATGLDYTIVENTGRVVGGSRTRERAYSEYWTLVRSATVRGAPRVDKSCPSCGAPLAIGMAGNCEHCSVHVTSGEFDWVLSKIEQDEAYRG
jgi:predicted lipid-binding transport protein (Tim44 family)